LARLALLDKGRKLSRRAPKRLVTADRFWGERFGARTRRWTRRLPGVAERCPLEPSMCI